MIFARPNHSSSSPIPSPCANPPTSSMTMWLTLCPQSSSQCGAHCERASRTAKDAMQKKKKRKRLKKEEEKKGRDSI